MVEELRPGRPRKPLSLSVPVRSTAGRLHLRSRPCIAMIKSPSCITGSRTGKTPALDAGSLAALLGESPWIDTAINVIARIISRPVFFALDSSGKVFKYLGAGPWSAFVIITLGAGRTMSGLLFFTLFATGWDSGTWAWFLARAQRFGDSLLGCWIVFAHWAGAPRWLWMPNLDSFLYGLVSRMLFAAGRASV